MTECISEIEDTRKEMYTVAKQMVKMKDSLINQKLQVVSVPGPGYSFGGMDRSQTIKTPQARPDMASPVREKPMRNTTINGQQRVGNGFDEGNPFE
jgi:hypothetical protein